jgi:hypothetical protein
VRGELPPLKPESLYPRRLAVRAFGIVLAQYHLEGVALKLNPDDPEQVFPGPTNGEIRLYDDGGHTGKVRELASVFLEDGKARVVIERLRNVVRRAHRKDFKPEELGVYSEPNRPDVDVEVDLVDVLADFGEAARTAPQRPRARRRRIPRVARYASALGRGRGR